MKRSTLRRGAVLLNDLTSRIGFVVLPLSFYSEVPNRPWLKKHRELWARPMVPSGQRWDLDEQIAWLRTTCSPYLAESEAIGELPHRFSTSYGPIEAQVLHCFIRTYAPRRIVEVGSGVSTAIMKRAVELNGRDGRDVSQITCVDPYSSPALRELDVEVMAIPAQTAPIETFTALERGDLLFIDSSHAVHTGSEVIRLYLEIIPRLASGVMIHIHDIYLPYLFSPSLFEMVDDPQETALVAALLTDNPRLRVLACLSAMVHSSPQQLHDILPTFRPRSMAHGIFTAKDGLYPDSLWLEVT